MLFENCAGRCARAAALFDEHERRSDGSGITDSIACGLDTLRSQLFERAQRDVEEKIGMDSMLLPVSPIKTEMDTNREIEVYQVAQSTDEMREQKYLADVEWYTQWLGTMRLGDSLHDPHVQDRLTEYLAQSSDQRRLEFSDVLVQTFPEARHIPLILYRLFPIAVRIATAIAFGDHARTRVLRDQQRSLLPGIADCQKCHGTVLDNGEQCPTCGNPVWGYTWLTQAD